MLLDESSSEIGVLCPNEDPDVEDLGEPGLTLSVQLARNALTPQGVLDDLRLVWIFERIGGDEFARPLLLDPSPAFQADHSW
jgi:hypothetical protein